MTEAEHEDLLQEIRDLKMSLGDIRRNFNDYLVEVARGTPTMIPLARLKAFNSRKAYRALTEVGPMEAKDWWDSHNHQRSKYVHPSAPPDHEIIDRLLQTPDVKELIRVLHNKTT